MAPARDAAAHATATAYERHRPEETVLYRTLEPHWPTFLERAEQAGGLPVAGSSETPSMTSIPPQQLFLTAVTVGEGSFIIQSDNYDRGGMFTVPFTVVPQPDP